MKTWWRVVAGFGAGGLEMFANGMDWRHILAGLGIAGLGIVSHLTSTSDPTSSDGTKH